ncbi:MAG: GumC family protein [Cyanobacterium sp.]
MAFVLGYLRSENSVPLYRASGLVIFDLSSSQAQNPFTISQESKLSNDIIIFKSDSIVQRTIDNLDIPSPIGTQQVIDNLTVTNPDRTDVLTISFVHENPEISARVVNELINTFAEFDQDVNLNQARELSLFLQEQIPQSQAELEATANQLRNFKQENLIIDIGSEAATTSRIIGELDGQVAQVTAELSAQRTRLNALREVFPIDAQQALNSSFINDAPIANSLLNQIKETRTELEKKRVLLADEHPDVILLQGQLDVLEQQFQNYTKNVNVTGESFQGNLNNIFQPGEEQISLLSEYASIEREVQSLESKLSSLNDLIATYRQRVNILPDLEFEQQQIDQELSIRRQLLNNLITNFQDTQLAMNNTNSRIRTIEYARVPDEPAINRRITYLVQGILAGVILASLVAYLLEQVDQNIKSVDEVKTYFDKPILGQIAKFEGSLSKAGSASPIKDEKMELLAENFKRVFINLNFMNSLGEPVKVITISSSVPDEGKSTTSYNLAIAAGTLEQKVLLVEADLRNPSQKGIFGVAEETKGLRDLLQKNNTNEPADFIQPSSMDNVDVLFAGRAPSDPLTLLASHEMFLLTEKLKEQYDLIIFDAPPVTVSADALVLSKISDGMLFIVRYGKAKKSLLESVKEALDKSEVNVLGLILNCFPANKDNYDSYYQNYYRNKSKQK